ncbi:helix-turn-helix domain-containing protein, partial [Oleiphilus sp. HI0123]
EDVELSSLTSEDQKERVLTVWNELGRPDGLKEIYEGCEQQIDYPEIRYAISLALLEEQVA